MTDPSQYFKGRTVQEQMTEVIGYVDTRAAEVATDAIASDVAQVHQDMLDADADASAAAASAAAAAGTLANAVKKTGEASQNIEGDVTLSTGDLSVAGDAGVQGQLSVLGGCDLRAPVKVPTVATGTFDDNAANGNKVKNELDAYVSMVRTANAQTIGGVKTFTDAPIFKLGIKGSHTFNSTANKYTRIAKIMAPSTQTLCYLTLRATSNDIRFTDIIVKSNTGVVDITKHYSISTSHIFAIRTSSDGGNTIDTLELYYYRNVSNNFALYINQTNRDSIVTDASPVSYDQLTNVPDYYDTLTVIDLDA